jgi:hypothetical protein
MVPTGRSIQSRLVAVTLLLTLACQLAGCSYVIRENRSKAVIPTDWFIGGTHLAIGGGLIFGALKMRSDTKNGRSSGDGDAFFIPLYSVFAIGCLSVAALFLSSGIYGLATMDSTSDGDSDQATTAGHPSPIPSLADTC